MTDTTKALRDLIALWDQAKAALERNGWRDIKTDPPEETRVPILCYEPPERHTLGHVIWDGYYYVTSGYALTHQYECGTEDQEPTHWQPLSPPE